MRVLLLSSRPGTVRRRALAPLLRDAEVVEAQTGIGTLDNVDAIVVDGPPAPRDLGELEAIRCRVEGGASLVAIGAAPRHDDGFWAPLLGAVCPADLPAAEYFATTTPESTDLTQRLAGEFAVVDRFQPLEVTDGAAVQVATVSVAFCDRAAIVEVRRGRGRVLVSGLGVDDSAMAAPDLAALLRRGLERRPSERRRQRGLGVGVVGYGPHGGMGFLHGTAATATTGLEFLATCDTSDERRKAAEADFPGVRVYTTAEQLAADDDVEIAVVATPPASHAAIAMALLRAGKHVVCEKPLCLTVAEADELVAAAQTHGVVLTANHNRRWDADFVALRRAVDAGLLGHLFNVETFVGGFEHPCRAWHSEESVSGGAVYDWGSHHVDWILQLMGSVPSTVTCHGHKRVWHDVTNLDQLRVRLTWEDGREGEFVQSDIAAVRRPKFYVQGTAGTLVGHYRPITFERVEPGRGYVADRSHHAEAPVELTLVRYESGYGLTETRLPVAPEQRYAFHRNLADHLHLGEPLAVTPESAREVVGLLEAAHRSAAQGGTLESLAHLS